MTGFELHSSINKETSMTGVKFKLAPKRADKETWSASTRAQRKKVVQILRQTADELEQQMVEEEKKVTPFRVVKRKSVRKQERVAA
jgi:hypothetical protein